MEFVHGYLPAAQHTGFSLQHFQQIATWLAVDIDSGHSDELHKSRESGACKLHMKLSRCRVRVDLYDRQPGAIPVEIHIVGNHPLLVGISKADHPDHSLPEFPEFSFTDLRRIDDNDRLRHSFSPVIGAVRDQ